MPCAGPSEAEQRAARKQEKFYKMILGIVKHERNPSNGWDVRKFRPQFIADVEANLKDLWGYDHKLMTFDEITAELCSIVAGFTAKEEAFYLYNGRVSACRKLAEWWESHQKLDKRRKRQELYDKAEEEAEEAAEKARASVMNKYGFE